MNKIESMLVSIINKHHNLPLVIAYSGGVDSQVLLHALAKLSQQNFINHTITVCHVNHGLSTNAQAWQQFAQQQCQQLNLPLTICPVNVKAQKQQSLEALARDARYQALQAINKDISLIITGHHSDDQSETFLLALKRGAGLKGLSSMRSETALGKHLLVRPLLTISRQMIVDYANEHALDWVEDESNSDTRFDRNFIRQQIMPLLTERWPSINRTINRSAAHCLEGQELLDELAELDLANVKLTEISLQVTLLEKLSIARFNNVIRFFLTKHNCLMPSTEQLAQLRQQLLAGDDKNPTVKVGDHYLRRFKNTLALTTVFADISAWQQVIDVSEKELKVGVSVELPDNLGLLVLSADENILISTESANGQRISLPQAKQQVSIRFYHDNPKCLPDYRQHSRSLKKVLQELNIAPWQRKRIAFLYYDDVLVAAIGHFVCKSYLAKNNERCIYLLTSSS